MNRNSSVKLSLLNCNKALAPKITLDLSTDKMPHFSDLLGLFWKDIVVYVNGKEDISGVHSDVKFEDLRKEFDTPETHVS